MSFTAASEVQTLLRRLIESHGALSSIHRRGLSCGTPAWMRDLESLDGKEPRLPLSEAIRILKAWEMAASALRGDLNGVFRLAPAARPRYGLDAASHKPRPRRIRHALRA